MNRFWNYFVIFSYVYVITYAIPSSKECTNIVDLSQDNVDTPAAFYREFTKKVIPDLSGKEKGDAGKIMIIAGSEEYSGAPYFSAMSALKAGADVVYVITTESAAPVVKSYSPDLVVFPYLNSSHISNINRALKKMDVVVIGPGLGRSNETLQLFYSIIRICSDLGKPLVIDADGLYALSKNVNILKNYTSAGVILTPNRREADILKQAVNNVNWYRYWGNNVGVLVKGQPDKFHSAVPSFDWSSSSGGSPRRVSGQGDMLAGVLGTMYNWSLKAKLCENKDSVYVAQSVATYASAVFIRQCNFRAYEKHGRSLIASDILDYMYLYN